MSMHPQIVAFLEDMSRHGFRPVQDLDPDAARAQYLRTIEVREIEPPPIAAMEDRTAPGPGGPVPVRVYRPESAPTPAPALIYYHGGGHVIGNIDTHDVPVRSLANAAGCVVISVDYRLGPEARFPAAVEDSFAALEWAATNADELGIDPARIAVGGDSAGGNLAAVVSLLARENGGPAIALQLLIYPVTDYACDTASYTTYATGFGSLHAAGMHWFRDHYLSSPADAADWRAAPLRAKNLSDLPPACVLLAECDVLHDEGLAYAEALREAGNEVELVDYPGMIHGFFVLAPTIDGAVQAQATAVAALRRAFSG